MNKNKLYILYGVMFVTFLPMVIFPLEVISRGFFTVADSLFILGAWLGLAGFWLLFWQYALGIRQLVGIFTHDTIQINKIHKFLGLNAVLFIFAHPLLLIIDSLINEGADLLKIKIENEFDLHVVFGKIAISLLFLTWGSSRFFKNRLSFRWWKRIHLLNYLILPFVFIHAREIGSFFISEPLEIYFYFLFIIFIAFVIIRILAQINLWTQARYTVVAVEPVSNGVMRITLEPKGEGIKLPEPGQFQHIKISIPGETHPFTISHFNSSKKQLSLSIKALGPFSAGMHKLSVGQVVFVEGPYGVFTQELYKGEIRKAVIIAGGIGITPFMRFVEYVYNNPGKFDEVFLFYGNKTTKDIAYLDDLNQVDDTSNPLKVIHVLDAVKEDEQIPEGFERGFITLDLIKKYVKSDLPEYTFFICGPPVMMKILSTALMKAGVPKSKIHKEEFGW